MMKRSPRLESTNEEVALEMMGRLTEMATVVTMTIVTVGVDASAVNAADTAEEEIVATQAIHRMTASRDPIPEGAANLGTKLQRS